jgi:hypothetical protein
MQRSLDSHPTERKPRSAGTPARFSAPSTSLRAPRFALRLANAHLVVAGPLVARDDIYPGRWSHDVASYSEGNLRRGWQSVVGDGFCARALHQIWM